MIKEYHTPRVLTTKTLILQITSLPITTVSLIKPCGEHCPAKGYEIRNEDVLEMVLRKKPEREKAITDKLQFELQKSN